MPETKTFDPSQLDPAAPAPSRAYLSTSVGAFCLSGRSGDAIFAWYHDDGTVDAHHHRLAYKGGVSLGSHGYFAYAPEGAGGDDHGHDLFLFSREPVSPHEGHRVFYLAHGHLHLWASDVRCLPLHGGGHDH